MNTKAKRINDFGRDHVPGLVLRVSVPFMFAQFVNVLYSIVDRIYIGNIPVTGTDSLAGAGVCAPIITLLSSFATLIGIGGSILFSMRLGQDDKKDAERILGNCFSTLLLFSAVLTVVFLLTKGMLLRWFGASDITYPYADIYLTIYTCGTFFRPVVHGHELFHHRPGISHAWNGNYPHRGCFEYHSGSFIYFCFSYGYCRSRCRYGAGAARFLPFCTLRPL